MKLLALDFDGVICDSARETGMSAWKAARELWPELCYAAEIPEKYLQKFVQVRPYLEYGYQSVLMLKMLLEELPLRAFQEELEENCQRIMQENSLKKADLMKRFSNAREQWLAQDLDGWLAAHGFYAGVILALQEALKLQEVHILTTKQECFAMPLLTGQGVCFPKEQLWGLERKTPKEELLLRFVQAGYSSIAFVEDRLDTLLRVMQIPELDAVKLYYATWGYSGEKEKQQAAAMKRINCIILDDFNRILRGTETL
ncbi:MAG: hypothetical protein GX946_04365 [Oligosphaeraceae bacterium]|nr:hypothetical protein [Oligosphaeraceae bacterium]